MGDQAREIVQLIEESDEFEECPDCGRYLARTSNHRCRTDEENHQPPNRAERRRRASEDDRGDDTLVGVFRRSGGNTYAYHDLTNGEPRCGCHHYARTDGFEVVTLAQAKSQGRSPCGSCQRVR